MNKIEHTKPEVENKLESGQFYFNSEDKNTYILTHVRHDEYQLISLKDGNRWDEPTKKINEVFDNRKDEFTLVTLPFTITPDIQ